MVAGIVFSAPFRLKRAGEEEAPDGPPDEY